MADSLAAIYAEIPSIRCKRKCSHSCGPVAQLGAMSPAEAKRLAMFELIPNAAKPLDCALLDASTQLCRAYAMRPLVCRMWGVVDDWRMRCPHGCEPERLLTNAEADALFARAVALSE